MKDDSFLPKIYVYKLTDPRLDGVLKVGYTTKNVDVRVSEQFGSRGLIKPLPYEILHTEVAIDNKGEEFMDHSVHSELERRGVERVANINNRTSEYFTTDIDTVISAIKHVKKRDLIDKDEFELAEKYIDVPLTAIDKETLAKELNITDSKGRLSKWRTIRLSLERRGFIIIESMPTINSVRTRVSIITRGHIK